MKIKTARKTIDIKFENRGESIAFMRAFGFVNIANAIQAAQDRELAMAAATQSEATVLATSKVDANE